MTLEQCITNTAQELGLDKREVEEIAKSLEAHRKRRVAEGRLDERELWQFGKTEAEKQRIAAALKKRHAAMNIILRDQWERDLGALMKAGLDPIEAVMAKLVGSHHAVAGARQSVMARRWGLEGAWLSHLLADLNKEAPIAWRLKHKRNAQSKVFFADVTREMYELKQGGEPGKTGNKDAQITARILAKYEEAARVEMNRAGANIGKLDGHAPQSHSARKMLIGANARQDWINFIYGKLNISRSFGDVTEARAKEILSDIYTTLTTGRDRTLTAKEKGERVGPANLAKSLEKHRVLHFKDADSWLAYAEKYSDGDVLDGVLDSLGVAARKASLMQMMGPNPEAFLNGILETLIRQQRDTAAGERPISNVAVRTARRLMREGWKNRTEGREDLAQELMDQLQPGKTKIGMAFDTVMGVTDIPINVTKARRHANVRAGINMTSLGMSLASQFPDLANSAHRMRFQGKGVLQSHYDSIMGFIKGGGDENVKERAWLIGVGFESVKGDINSRYSAGDQLAGRMAQAHNAFFKLNGTRWWTQRNETAFANMISAWMAIKATKPYEKLDDAYKHVLNIHGIGGERWNIVRQIAKEGFVMPDDIRDLPDEVFDGLVAKRLEGVDQKKMAKRRERLIEKERLELEFDLRSFFADETTYAIVKGDDRTRAIVTQGTHPGTNLGEAMRYFMQMKSFAFAYSQRILHPILRGQSGPGGRRDFGGTAMFVAMSLVYGYLSGVTKDVLKNREPKDPDRWETILASLLQSGGLGIYGDFLFGEVNRFGVGSLETLAGPFVGKAAELVDKFKLALRGDTKAGDWLYAVSSNLPYVNLWFSKAAFDWMVMNHLAEWASPGTLKRREKKMEEQFGQSYLIEPR